MKSKLSRSESLKLAIGKCLLLLHFLIHWPRLRKRSFSRTHKRNVLAGRGRVEKKEIKKGHTWPVLSYDEWELISKRKENKKFLIRALVIEAHKHIFLHCSLYGRSRTHMKCNGKTFMCLFYVRRRRVHIRKKLFLSNFLLRCLFLLESCLEIERAFCGPSEKPKRKSRIKIPHGMNIQRV